MKKDILFNLLTIVIIVFFIVLQNFNKRKYLRSVQLQNYVWLAAFVIYALNIIPYYPLNDLVYVSAILYLASFNISSFIRPTVFLKHQKKDLGNSTADSTRINKCLIASVLCWILSYNILKKSIPVIIQYGAVNGLNALRYRTYGEFTIFTTFEMMLMTYIIRPVFTVTIILLAEEIAQRRISVWLLIVAVLDAFWLILATAGRALLVSLIIYVFLAVIVLNGANIWNLFKKYRKYTIPVAIFLVVVINIFSRRINRNNGFIEEGIIYYFSGLPYFSAMLESGNAVPFYLYGKGLFSFIFDIPILFLRLFRVSNIIAGSQYLSTLANSILPIGEHLTTNATASTLLTFYSDFGVLGSVLGGMTIGRIATNVESRLEKEFTPITFGRYLYVLAGAAITIQNYSFVGSVATMTWVFISLLLA